MRKKGRDFDTKSLKRQSRNPKFPDCERRPISCSASLFGPEHGFTAAQRERSGVAGTWNGIYIEQVKSNPR